MPSVHWPSSGISPAALNAKADQDTICAAATPSGRGGVGVVRVSGPAVPELIQHWLGRELPARRAILCSFLDSQGEIIDHGLALYFPAPHSYTGEAVLELQGHGNPILLEALIQQLLRLGVRRAQPGEFTQRAFLNERMDLAQAEAVADLIAASSLHSARAAQRSLEGVFSRQVEDLVEALIRLRIYVEAGLDFPDEDIDILADGQVLQQLEGLQEQLAQLLLRARQGRMLNHGLRVAIVGRPNAGKSSLLNALSGSERAIVTAIPGTTRDVLSERLHIQGLPIELLDTAGLRETDDIVEAEGVRRAHREIARADLVLWLVDASADAVDDTPPQCTAAVLKIHNKIDLLGQTAHQSENGELWLSAKAGIGLDLLEQAILRSAGLEQEQHSEFTARARHVDILEEAAEYLELAHQQLVDYQAGELVAEELKRCSDLLGEITGKISSDELLGRIFSSFCIGK